MGYDFGNSDRIYVRMDERNEGLLYSAYDGDTPVSEGEITRGSSVFEVHGLLKAVNDASLELVMGAPPVLAEAPQ